MEKKKNPIELILETDRLLDRILEYNRLLDWVVYIEKEYKQHGLVDLLKIVVAEAYHKGYIDGKKEVVNNILKVYQK